MKKNFIYLMLASTVLLSACSTKLDVTGDWKETLVVYGLLDQSQPKQYIKINKAFLGQGDAYQMAQVKDSTQFAQALNVKIQRLNPNTGAVLAEYALTPDNTIPKDPGVFYGPDQTNVIYSFPTPVTYVSTDTHGDSVTSNATLVEADQYKLVVQNSETGKQLTATTPLVERFDFTKPSVSGASFGFVATTVPNLRFYAEWNTSKNGRLYELVIRFNYIDSTATGNIARHLDWAQTPQETAGLTGLETMNVNFVGMDFIKFIGGNIPNDPAVIARIPGKVDLIVTGGADELNTFINVNKPSTGLVQERPEYTNVTNGLGIFSARYNRFPFSRPMSDNTLSELSNGTYTNCLKFLYQGTWTNGGSCH